MVRQYTIEDVRKFREMLNDVPAHSCDRNAFSKGVYKFIVSGSFHSPTGRSPLAPNVSAYSEVKEEFGGPNVLRDAWAVFKVGDASESASRLYINPTNAAMPYVARELIAETQSRKLPADFKFVDLSVPQSGFEGVRADRFVVYTGKGTEPLYVNILNEITKRHVDWFEGRPLPAMTGKHTPFIGYGDEPTEVQKKLMTKMFNQKDNQSFNYVRANFLIDVWREAMSGLLLDHSEFTTSNGLTIKQHFDDACASIGTPEDLRRAYWTRGLSHETTGEDPVWGRLAVILQRTMPKVIPKMSAQSLLKYVGPSIQIHAPRYGIDTNDLARSTK